MRVLLFTEGALPRQGGIEYKNHFLANALVDKGVDLIFFSLYRKDPHKVMEKLPIRYRQKYYWLPRSRGLFHATLTGLYLRHIMNKYDFDIILASLAYPAGYWAIRVRNKLRIPVVVMTEADDVQDRPYFQKSKRVKRLIRQTIASANAVTALCNSTATDCLEKGANADRLRIIPNGVDHESIMLTNPKIKNRPYILTISSPSYVKGIEILIHAFLTISQQVPDLDLVIIGVSPDSVFQKLSDDLGLSNRIFFAGTVVGSEKYAFLKGCKFFVLPSRSEAFPLVLLEAKAAGKAIIATRVGGIPEIVTHNCDGLLVPPDNPEALAEAMFLILKTPSLLVEMENHSNKNIHLYSWTRICDQYISIFENLIPHNSLSQ